MDQFAEQRLVKNELIFRAANRKVQKQVQKDHLPRNTTDTSKLHFYCECSDFSCRERIVITADEYEKAHKMDKHFIIIAGHENGSVEKVFRETPDFHIVEKFMDPAKLMHSQ